MRNRARMGVIHGDGRGPDQPLAGRNRGCWGGPDSLPDLSTVRLVAIHRFRRVIHRLRRVIHRYRNTIRAAPMRILLSQAGYPQALLLLFFILFLIFLRSCISEY